MCDERPRLLFFYSRVCGRSRRVEGYLSHVLQRRHNHEAFRLHRIEVSEEPELARRLRVAETPTLLVVADQRVRGRLIAPRSCLELERVLGRWLH